MKHEQISAALYSIEAEQQILGAVLGDNEAYHRVSSMISADHFYDAVHARIWRNIVGRIERDHIASPVTVGADMALDDGLKELGGKPYLGRLVGASVAGFAVADYAQMIVEMAQRRELSGRLQEIAKDVADGRGADDAASELELLLHEREENSSEPRTMSFLRAQTDAVAQLEEIRQGRMVGVPSGIAALDEKLPLMPKRYTILGGSTSMGKSALALSIALNAARAGHGVGFVTLEMPEVDLANRINSAVSMVPYKAYDRPLSENSMRAVVDAAKDLTALPLEIFSERVRDVPAILSEGKKLKRKMAPNGPFKGFRLLVIDYIQLVRGRGENSLARLSQVANDLKQVAKHLDVHVLALAQIDRNISKEENYQKARPKPADLRGSGDLENAPDNAIFVFRPEYYLTRQTPPKKDEERADWEADIARWKDKAEIIIGKARMGEIGSITVGCDMATNRFFDLPDTTEEEMF